MPVNIPRLRWWFAALAIALIVVVTGFYSYGRYRLRRAIKEIPQKIGINIQQSTTGFTFSKSEGGRTIFTVHASQAVEYKGEGRAELKDVNIIVYGRQANRFDQIYGSDFEYDPHAGTIAAKGEVHIDIEGNAEGPINPDQAAPQELKNPIHLKTSGLVFNRITGMAETKERLEFRVPQASGSAIGASYDSRAATLTLGSNIQFHSNAPHEADIKAAHGVITKGPNRAVLEGVSIQRPNGNFSSQQLTVYLRDDNTIERLLAAGDVKAHETGKTTVDALAPQAEAVLGPKNDLRTANMTGGVSLITSGKDNIQANAGKLLFTFASQNAVDQVRATDGVRLLQQPANGSNGRPVEITAGAMDFVIRNGRVLTEAVTSGATEIKALPATNATGDNAGTTTLTAGQFRARFQKNRLTGLTGAPETKIVMSTPGQSDKISTSDRVEVGFAPTGGISSLVQEGNFHYLEEAQGGRREAWAHQATYIAGGQGATDVLKLNGSPRFVEGGMTSTADAMEIGRTSGDAFASGNVKTTYSELRPQPGGALLASADPIHVTATTMTARRSAGSARYQNARLWQGANVIEAPSIDFQREPRGVVAAGDKTRGVTTLFIEQDKNGKSTPVNVTAAKLTYSDPQRQAHFEGGVTMKGADSTLTTDRLDIYLQAARPSQKNGEKVGPPSQLDRAVASGNVVIQAPNKRATGENLVYTATNGQFVLTGGPPSIFDAERGKITGDSLTFFQHDDRVLVESKSSPTVTRTRVAK
jgi:lipopolysaccharide export system protein LptA